MQRLITTPIYYVNDRPHIGHAYTSIAADTLARWNRLNGHDTFLLTGTDEHGQKIAKAAEARGLDPQSFTDEVSQTFRDLTTTLNIGPHGFIRTTDRLHKSMVQALWTTLVRKDAIYLGTYSGWYAVRDEAFYVESDTHVVEGKRRAITSGAEVEWVEEPSYFFRLSAFGDRLLAFYEENPDFIFPAWRRNEAVSMIRSGLPDLCVSRASVKWGIPVPNDPAHTIYVWLDALTNYISGWHPWGITGTTRPVTHIIGKDILKFHAIFWPAFLLAAEIPLPERILVHGWWTNEGQKISKSLGNTIDPVALVNEVGVDAVRYYLLREVPFGHDGNFRRENLLRRRDELANGLGNLAHRTLTLIQKDGGFLPPINTQAQDFGLAGRINSLLKLGLFSDALEDILGFVSFGNSLIVQQAPWTIKDPVARGRVLREIYDVLRTIATLLQPFIPGSASMLLDQLGVPADQRTIEALNTPMPEGTPLPPPSPVFRKSA